MSDKATLHFRTNFHSSELSGLELPVEIRAGNRRLVTRALTSKAVQVDAGKYFVSSRLPAGQELHAFVEVAAGQTVEVLLEPDACDESPSESMEVQHFLRRSTYRAPKSAASDLSISSLQDMGGLESLSPQVSPFTALPTWRCVGAESFAAAPTEAVEVTLPDVVELRWFAGNLLEKKCQLIASHELHTDTKPQPVEFPPEVLKQLAPVVCQIRQAGATPSNSLIPIGGDFQPPMLTLLPPEPGFPAFRIGVRLQHNTADLLTRYLRRGMFLEAGESVASDSMNAQQLIENKRTDPIAACVGAYTILRLGELKRLHQWTENLRNWFPWLPDGAAIRGEHLARVGKHHEALTVFLELKSRGLPLFSEGFSYALERLRLYTGQSTAPPGSTAAEIASARELLWNLNAYGVYADFDRTYVTFSGQDPASPSASQSLWPFDPSSPFGSPGVSPMSTELDAGQGEFVFNGINGATGEYLEPPKTAHQVVTMALADPAFQVNLRGQDPAARHLKELKSRNLMKDSESFGPRFGVDPNKLEEAGWAVVFPRGVDPHIVDALRPLLNRRKDQAGTLYKEFAGDKAYMKGDSKDDFLRRQGMGPGQPDPPRVPYYVLIVGDPEAIPYSFQYQLDVQYAVGRIWFETIDEYARYAESVIHAETGKISLPRKVALFGAQNPGDRATELSAKQLVTPLAARAQQRGAAGQWQVDSILSADATRSRLAETLGGEKTPALLFTATHGMGFPRGDSRQLMHQGALLCQDWPGPAARRVDREHYFAAEDISDSARVAGMICFHFACYGMGTPLLDDFAHQSSRPPTAIAPRPFVAALPRRLLGHPLGGALAVIGHVERAWGCSIVWPDVGSQIQAFEDTMDALMQGLTAGQALEAINQRYADLSSALSLDLLAIRDTTKDVDDFVLASQWTANNDARSYVLIGDPAVRLPVAAAGSPGTPRSVSTPITIRPASTESTSVSTAHSANKSVEQSGMVSQGGANVTSNDFGVAASQAQAPQVPSTVSVTINVPLKLTISVAVDSAAAIQALPVTGTIAPTGAAVAPAGMSAFGIEIDTDYDNRQGYDPEFLGTGTRRVPLPKLSAAQLADAAVVNSASDSDRQELKYHHYSVVLNGKRRLAFFTAVNINGKQAASPTREKDKWIFDPRVPQSMQAGEDLYVGNKLDRGHLVRRLDPAWGRTAAIIKRANDDTFHLTNCSPQHERFNQGKNLWAGLEDYLLNKASGEDRLMTVFTGPVFTTSDPLYRDIRVPKHYWKVAVIVRPNGKLASLGFIVDQTALLQDTVSFGAAEVAKTFQTPVSRIEELTGLSFGRLTAVDVGDVASFAIGEPVERELTSFEDIALPTTVQTTVTTAFDAPASSLPLPPETVEGTDLRYYLVSFDEIGNERRDHPAGQISRMVEQAVADPATTDVLLVSHGWQGDVPGARDQYTRWIRAMAASAADRTRIRQVRPGFKPVIVGIHWPSQPWGDENLGAVPFGLDTPTGGNADQASLATTLEEWTDRLGDNPDVRERIRPLLRTILEFHLHTGEDPTQLPPELREAYLKLDSALGMGSSSISGGNPSSDRDPFDPAGVYEASRTISASTGQGVSFAGGFFSRDTLLSPLRSLSFWKMKDRGRVIGEGAVHDLLVRLQQAAGNRPLRFHLAGHSFGCIVVSGAISGPAGSAPLQRPIDSLSLLQGAVSLWSYCSDIPHARGTPGYYHKLIAENRVRGPIVTTRSSFDSAVGTWYPLASRVSRSVSFDVDFPKYGGIGSFGIQGDVNTTDLEILAADQPYALVPGSITNVEASKVINKGGGWSGAHSDIAKPEVAHLVWSAVVGAS